MSVWWVGKRHLNALISFHVFSTICFSSIHWPFMFLAQGFFLLTLCIMNTLSTECAENIFPHLWLFTIMGFFFLNIQSFIFLGVESLNLFLYSCWVSTSWGRLPHSISLKALLSEIILENTDSNICNTHNALCSLYKNQTFNFGKTDLIWTIIFSSYNK